MPQNNDRRSLVLDWDDVYAQFAQTAASMPVEEVDRHLAAMGYDLDRVRAAAGRLGQRPGARRAHGPAMADPGDRADAALRPVPSPAAQAPESADGAHQRRATWRAGTRCAAAGVVAVALLAWLAVPVSETGVGRRTAAAIAKGDAPAQAPAPHAKIAEASPAGGTHGRETNSETPDMAKPYAKAAGLKKCGAAEDACGKAKAASGGDKLIKASADDEPPRHDLRDANAAADAKGGEASRLTAMARDPKPASAG